MKARQSKALLWFYVASVVGSVSWLASADQTATLSARPPPPPPPRSSTTLQGKTTVKEETESGFIAKPPPPPPPQPHRQAIEPVHGSNGRGTKQSSDSNESNLTSIIKDAAENHKEEKPKESVASLAPSRPSYISSRPGLETVVKPSTHPPRAEFSVSALSRPVVPKPPPPPRKSLPAALDQRVDPAEKVRHELTPNNQYQLEARRKDDDDDTKVRPSPEKQVRPVTGEHHSSGNSNPVSERRQHLSTLNMQRPQPGGPSRSGRPGEIPQPGGPGPVAHGEYRQYPNRNQHNQRIHPPNTRHPPPRKGQAPPPQSRQQQPGSRPPPRRPPNQNAPTWKVLWRKVEKGLDNLADLEEIVTERAQQVYSSAKRTVSSVHQGSASHGGDNFDSFAASSSVSRHSRRRPPSKVEPVPQMDMARFTKKAVETESRPIPTTSSFEKQRKPWEHSNAGGIPNNPYSTTGMGQSFAKSNLTTPAPQRTSITNSSQTRPTGFAQQPATSAIGPNGGASTPSPSPSTYSSNRPMQFQGNRQPGTVPREVPPRRTPPTRMAHPNPPQTARRRRYDDDDDDDDSFFSKILGALPSLPRLPSLRFLLRGESLRDTYAEDTWDAWKAADDNDSVNQGGFFSRLRGKKKQAPSKRRKTEREINSKRLPVQLGGFMERCKDGESLKLLNVNEKLTGRSIGKSLAVFDIVGLAFLLVGLKQMPAIEQFALPDSVGELFKVTLPAVYDYFLAGIDTWAPFALIGALFTMQTRQLFSDAKFNGVARSIESSVLDESQFGALFLRLFTSLSHNPEIGEKMQLAALSQLAASVDLSRLRRLANFSLLSLAFTALPLVHSLTMLLIEAMRSMLESSLFSTWPPAWQVVYNDIWGAVSVFGRQAADLVSAEASQFVSHPERAVFGLSVAAALWTVSLLPIIGKPPVPTTRSDDDEDEEQHMAGFSNQVANLGVTSASRLAVSLDSGGFEGALQRWRLLSQREKPDMYGRRSYQSTLKLAWKFALSTVIVCSPLLLHGYAGLPPLSMSLRTPAKWGSVWDIAILLLFIQMMAWRSINSVWVANEHKNHVSEFVKSLSSAIKERVQRLDAPPLDLQNQASISPTSGLSVRDLWCAHASKRAWAVRGVNLDCRSGEVLLILGDESAGKTRLLTALAEAIVEPPKPALTTTRVRGAISVGGLDVGKWDRLRLQRRVRVMLQDIRSMSDISQVLSGLSLEEIIEPSGGMRYLELSHKPSQGEQGAMSTAMRITGLQSTLLPKLPSKLATIVTANEEDTRSVSLRPHLLSAGEWSRLLLARVLSQAIYENDLSNDNLRGSLLLLDDATLYLPEMEEARLIRELRNTGAATLLSSNRWAAGRFADRIAVMREGAIVESGTHAELISRGSQQSLYAAKWHAMTSL